MIMVWRRIGDKTLFKPIVIIGLNLSSEKQNNYVADSQSVLWFV